MNAGDHPRRHEERQRRHRHHLEGVDLLGDPHRAELGGEAAADGRGQGERGDQRGDLAGVEVGRDEAGELRDAERLERAVALQPDLGPAKNDRTAITPTVPAITTSAPEPKATSARRRSDLLAVAPHGARDPGDARGRRRDELVAEVVEAPSGACSAPDVPIGSPSSRCGTSWK